MDILSFSKNIRYPDFRQNIINFFSQNAAIYNILKDCSDNSDMTIDANVLEDEVFYNIHSTNTGKLELLQELFKNPVSTFGYTHSPVIKKTEDTLIVKFNRY